MPENFYHDQPPLLWQRNLRHNRLQLGLTAPQYLTSLLTSASEFTGRQYLRSAVQQKLIVPRCPSEDVWLSGVFGSKSVSLECITGQSERSSADFRHFQASFGDLLLYVILDVSHVHRIRDFLVMRYINVRFTYFTFTYYTYL